LTAKVKLLFADTTIQEGGLLRCCLASIAEYVEARAEQAAPPELVISCVHETYQDSENIILREGVWYWNHD
jgi:hypothetical protein